MRTLIPVIMLTFWAIDGNAAEWLKRYLVSEDTTISVISCGAAEAHPNDPRGGYLVVGFGISGPHPSYLLRIDVAGRTLWEKWYPHLCGTKSAHYTDDGGFLIGGNFGITKVDKDGNPAWGAADTDGTPLAHYKGDMVRSIKKLGDKRYLCVFSNRIAIVSEKDSCATPDSVDLPFGFLALPTSDGGAVSCIGTYIGTDTIVLSKIKSDGTPDSAFGFNGKAAIPGYGDPYSLDCSSNEGYIIACKEHASERIVLVKTDKKGTQVSTNWNGRFDNLLASGYIPQMTVRWGVKTLSSGGYLLAGTYFKGTTDESDYFILKADEVGNEVWSKRFDQPGIDGYF